MSPESGAADGPESVEEDVPERPPTMRFLDALAVKRNALVGLVVGVGFAAAVYAFFVLLPAVSASIPARTGSPLLFLMLAFVIATSTALLVAAALTVVSLVRLQRSTE